MLYSCKNEHFSMNSCTANIISGNPKTSIANDSIEVILRNDDSVELLFSQDDLLPDKFYSVTIVLENDKNIALKLFGSDNDINRTSVYDEINDEGACSIGRVVKTDTAGRCSFSLLINSDSKTDVNVKITSIDIKSADFSDEYVIYESTDKTIRIVYYYEDVLKSKCSEARIIQWLDDLSVIRRTLSEFSENGLSQVDYCATQSFDHYGLSGNPIYVCRKYVVDDLNELSKNNSQNSSRDILWRYVHEMAHIVDGVSVGETSTRIFDSEFSAQIECAYAIMVNDFRYSNSKTALEYFSDKTNLSVGVYSDESFVFRLLQILENNSVDIKTLKSALLSEKYTEDMSKIEKIDVFLDELTRYSKIDIRGSFSKKELDAIYSAHKD